MPLREEQKTGQQRDKGFFHHFIKNFQRSKMKMYTYYKGTSLYTHS